ncbi:hypothetical protein A2291_01580 [candidate division WOR-1 bacterium RIFOXYB2_FULL_42_35]|uniref:Acid phosphatase n=1 Tax=candidate division WOR-1 bacterium RIFOXYC2_FULL_41_25 TaxID=1802586 RepID=A0A1F4TQH0_UNCSA|nr:MAG: hypothetical protein A2247_03380 [candidate division WOR-1 bacterium RIFOXYA2_FULL_41_14]OGC25481.1 MAG: hypothetical protein A2291_01580 [candidate division WOR-1 bacterium RIFOXYB2_FULL_42_35]OGC34887.1 MAG: hypothetical protein A2462_05515 [candidate division WOR-1 bacterium RIFOXYC2_FULL_41_25]OGC41869.1 MAG: hypothetical protein A2548_03715 [candidate division WOR-1 bacterium RIFOXYD2_FULL_41_8]
MLFHVFSNFSLIAVIIAWFLAQMIKVLIYGLKDHDWNIWHFFEAGGMPSAHSASVTALTLSVALTLGMQNQLFTACSVFALIVMYDATGVRRAAGKQAEILNKIVDDIYSTGKVKVEKLKEILGHSVIEVIAGVFLAVIVTLITYYVYFIR